VDARYTVADPDWENEYIVSFDCVPNTEPWRIHRYALPYYEQVKYYLNNVHVRLRERTATAACCCCGI
jgi:hypothetical protein